MKRVLPLLAVLLTQACGEKDRSKVLFNDGVTIQPRQLFYKTVDLPIGGSFTMTIAADGGELEAWSQPGAEEPYVAYDRPARPNCLKVASGAEGTDSATLGWGSTTFVVFNRNTTPVKAKIKLVVLSNER